MRKIRLGLFIFLWLIVFAGCRKPREINVSFYYWKTSFQLSKTEQKTLADFHSNKIYVRMMDVDLDENSGLPVPVSPIVFKQKIPDSVEVVPVVFLVNNALKNLRKNQLEKLSGQLLNFVNKKINQAGKTSFHELQIDCDWTATTRDNYFYLLKAVRNQLQNQQILSVTIRLHQLKNQKSSGIPPANRVLLMCYNMGNLRKYGPQNSILDLPELKQYVNQNIRNYPLPADVALPLFSWAVVFRNQQYAGISKRLNFVLLQNKNNFEQKNIDFYVVKTALPDLGLQPGDEVRWENVSADNLYAVTRYLSDYLKNQSFNLIFFHLDEPLLKTYTINELEKTADLLR